MGRILKINKAGTSEAGASNKKGRQNWKLNKEACSPNTDFQIGFVLSLEVVESLR